MGSETTVIPTIIVGDGETIEQNSDGEIAVKKTYQESLAQSIAEAEIEIIQIQAALTYTPIDHDSLISDTMSDTNGYENSVDTANTTARWTGALVYARQSANGTQATGKTLSSSGAVTESQGYRFTAIGNWSIVSATKHASCTATRCRLFTDAGAVLGTASFSGTTATFSSPIALTNNTVYRIEADNSGASYTRQYLASAGYVFATTGMQFTSGSSNQAGTSDTNAYNLVSFDAQGNTNTQVVKANLGTITGIVSAVQLVLNCPNRETGDNVTFDITDGTTTLTNQVVGQKITWTGSSNPSSININLVPKSPTYTDGTPSIKTYALKIWKA